MARNSSVAIARQLLSNRSKFCTALLHRHSLPSSSFQTLASSIPTSPPPPPITTPSTSNSLHHSPNPRFLRLRPLSSPSGSSNIVVIKSEDEYNSAISKAKDKAEPTLFYFTAVWCGPSRFISPVIGELSEQYLHVTTYKIDIDEEGLTNTLGKLNISVVPTFHLFQDGKKVAEVVGADVARLRGTFGKLYNVWGRRRFVKRVPPLQDRPQDRSALTEEVATLKGQLAAQEAAWEAEIAAQLSAQDDKMSMILRVLQMSRLQIPMLAPDHAPSSTSQPLCPVNTQ